MSQTMFNILWDLTITQTGIEELGTGNLTSARSPRSDIKYPQLFLPTPPERYKIENPPVRLFAIVIGIDEYKHQGPALKNLRGAVTDANMVVKFLQTSMGVPKDQIQSLRNEDANRLNILQHIRAIVSNPQIEAGDPILIFFAGYGARATRPTGWPPSGDVDPHLVQMLCPYDFVPRATKDHEGQGIPDVTLGVLLHEVSEAKGDNITVILDCSYSVSGSKAESEDPLIMARGVNLPRDYTIPPTIDADLLWHDTISFANKAIEEDHTVSYVLLSACRPWEDSREGGRRGRFTEGLLEALQGTGTDLLTYEALVNRLPNIEHQTPQLKGAHTSRILFDAKVPGRDRFLYKVTMPEPAIYQLGVGAASGITVGARFSVYTEKRLDSQPLGVLIVTSTRAFTSEATTEVLDTVNGLRTLPLPSSDTAYAMQTRAGIKHALRVHVPNDPRVRHVFHRLLREMNESEKRTNRPIIPVERDASPPPDIALVIKGDEVAFETYNASCRLRGLTQLCEQVPCDSNLVFSVISSAAEFAYCLDRSAATTTFTGAERGIRLECFEVEQTTGVVDDEYVMLPKDPEKNLVDNGSINVFVEDDKIYGFKIVNDTDLPLWIALMYFDMSDLSISPYGQTGPIRTCDPSVYPRDSLTIGYGTRGWSKAHKYYLRTGQKTDVGFLKLFVSLKHFIWSSDLDLVERSPLHGAASHDALSKMIEDIELWDTVLVSVVQHSGLTPLV